MSTTEFPFHIPHIVDNVANYLLFSDLLSCILVNRHWCNGFIPILWEDVITFRSVPTTQLYTWRCHNYTRDPGHQGFQKHAQHIRALTCQGPHPPNVLSEMNCVHLQEINYIVDRDLDNDNFGLQELAKLISINPHLRAVSIENVTLHSEATAAEYDRFVDFLDGRPAITSVYLEAHEALEPAEKWRSLWLRLLARVQTSHIHTLRGQYARTRSTRAPRKKPWPTRESPIRVKYHGYDHFQEWQVQGGRWEMERRVPKSIAANYYGSISIQESDGELWLDRQEFGTVDDWMAFLKRLPNIHSLELGSMNGVGGLLAAVPELFPMVSSLDISDNNCEIETLEKLLGSTEWSSLALELRNADQDRVLRAALVHSSVLTSLMIDDMNMDEFLVVVARCLALRSLNVEYLRIRGNEAEVPTWACTKLRELSFVLLYGPEADENAYAGSEALGRQELAVKRVAPLFMKQLGSMSALETLEVGLHDEGYVRDSPFLQFTLDPVSGLPQLSELKRLEHLKIAGVLHRVGQQEIEWMARTWPRLVTLELPMLRELEDSEQVLELRDTYQGQVPDFSKWAPRLKMKVPVHCYGYWKDEWFMRGMLDWTWVYRNERVKCIEL